MVSELIDTIGSLIMLMDEETSRLQQPGRFTGHQELTAAKLRLVAAMEQRLVALSRSGRNWLEQADPGERAQLLAVLETLRAASDSNAQVLARQIDLSVELMAIVSAEAQRMTGKRSAAYCGLGLLTTVDVPAPISVNTSL